VYKDNAQPLKSSRVRIFTTGDGSADEGLVVFTNNLGEFSVGNLAAGKYYVTLEDGPGTAMRSGFGMKIPLPISAIPKPEEFEEIIPRHEAEFSVDGTNSIEIEVRVARGGGIAGKVLKANGAPAENVAVNFISREGAAGGPYTARFSARTNKDGTYRIEKIPEGDYIVSAAIEARSSNFDLRARLRGESQIVTYHPAAISIRDALTVRVDSGRETGGVNVTLVARNSFAVAGTVVRQVDGTPIAGANVILRNKESETDGALVMGMGQRTTTTDADGRWSFSNVMEGQYVVTALVPNGPMGRVFNGPPALRNGQPVDREQAYRESRQRFLVMQKNVSVAAADISGFVMSISGPGSIVGRVEAENGALPSNLVVFLELIGNGTRPGPPLPVRVKPDGTFNVGGIPGGDVYLSVALPPDSNYFVRSLTANGVDLRGAPLKVVEGAEAGPVNVVISSAVGTLIGRVLSEKAGEGVGNLVVLFAPVEPEKQRFRTSYLTARTDPNGQYSVSGAPGEYFVLARRRDELPGIISEEFIRSQAPTANRVVIVAGQSNRMDLRSSNR
jgi:carboxypeptidase family protein